MKRRCSTFLCCPQDLEHEVAILKQKIEVDAKLNKQSAAAASREYQQLKNKLVVANANLDEKDKELRAALLEVKKLTRK
jgi:seryl-tRNA synthetase